ncbi:MAG: hypothetical protein ACRD03_14705 [Acidimicrobiales bacterium]
MTIPFDPSTFWHLRASATLAAAVSARVLLTDGARTLVEVRRPPLPEHAGHPLVPPCWFRSMVVHGRLGFPHGTNPLVDQLVAAARLAVRVELDHPGASLPGGVWRLDHPSTSTYVFATALPACSARAAVGAVTADGGFLEDSATGVTLVSATMAGETAGAEAAYGAALDMLARCAAAELVADLEQAASEGRDRR